MSANERLGAARATGLAMLDELEVRLMATRLRPRGQRMDAVAIVAADVDAAMAAAERVFGPREDWTEETRR